jgi:hypothetical protein
MSVGHLHKLQNWREAERHVVFPDFMTKYASDQFSYGEFDYV